ncbi:MAG: ABC transporter substrate binding protein [Gallionella sp.]
MIKLATLLACTAVFIGDPVHAERLIVNLVVSETGTPYQQFAKEFKKALGAVDADVGIVESHTVDEGNAGLIVAVGMRSAKLAVLQPDTPVLFTMIPASGYRDLMGGATITDNRFERMVSAIYLNQPMSRQIDFIKAVLPNRSRIGVLYSSEEDVGLKVMRKVVIERGFSLVTRRVGEAGLFPVLEKVLSTSDLLLAIPDGSIYNSSSIRNILLTSYRRSVPLIGISRPYVRAGALGAIFSTPEQLAIQAAETVILFTHSKQLAAPQYPAEFNIEVNREVGRSLGIVLPSKEVLRTRLGLSSEGHE